MAVMVVFAVSSGCKGGNKKEQGPVTLASVNGTLITGDDLFLRLGGHAADDPKLRDRVLESLINEELLYQKAVKLGLDRDWKYQNSVRQLESRVTAYKRSEMTRRMRDTQIASKVSVTDQDVKNYYDEHAGQITTELHLGILQFDDAQTANETLNAIRAGKPFEKAAAEKYPHVRKGERPWDKGFMRWNQMPEDLLDEVYRLKTGEVSDVLTAGKNGFYVVNVVDRRKNSIANFENMAASILNRLNAIRIAEAYNRYVQQLKQESNIKKF